MRKVAILVLAALLLVSAYWVIVTRFTDAPASPSYRYYIVEFKDPTRQSHKDDVSSAGADLVWPYPPDGFIARISPSNVDVVRRVPSVRSVDLVPLSMKIDRGLRPLIDRNETVAVTVTTWPREDVTVVAAAAKKLGAEVVSGPSPSATYGRMRLSIRGGAIPDLAEIEEVAYIGVWEEPKPTT